MRSPARLGISDGAMTSQRWPLADSARCSPTGAARRAALRHPPASPFFGPSVVRAAFLLAVFDWGTGVCGPPVYLHAVVARSGWPLAAVSRATAVAGAILTSLGMLGWALAAERCQLFAAALASGGGWVTMGAFAINAIVAP